METVLITGASSGIGREFSKLFAEKGYRLVITARREKNLAELKKMYPENNVEVIPCDLGSEAGAEYLYNEVKKRSIKVDILINNAGFGLFGEFYETDIEKEKKMIDLNVKALVELSKYFLQEMLERNSGRILNVASIAAFQPGPYMSVYYASKAFVLSFSEALRNEVRNTGVCISVLCPGPVETEFEKSSELTKSKLFSKLKPITAEKVAYAGYRGLMKNRAVIIPGFFNRAAITAGTFVPTGIKVNIARKIQEKKK
ncbi:NADP-dependent 3-hydroxy acid dehydrogenase YdfG [Sebaldella termitidis]|uniref:Short-chain dehydrogenase/reductase SDR n=1 Tax=Sebaldella termitidis (strain ATCC 33386 / NCTC 11300) TaxID=526218 RepID=D1AFS9_SEBTE|nr:SDR family oxidoreductase [Sebaldella termitidis]ACZ07964.1 short-chain dehydrogenase/reductase SDR [Sebaldella termitidis ATCC 33386]SUI23265.1 NADP-dependent 3-hydroxy acid dehydrogenase YdfG [Sebaldella termitidis]